MKKNVFSLVLWTVLILWQQSHAQQTDISVNNDPGQCSAIVTYTVPETTYQDSIPPHTLSGYDTIGFKDGNYYYISQTEEPAAESYANAHNLNAYVATVLNADVNQFLANYLSTNNIASAEIGYNDIDTEGTFVWDSGSTSTYTNWAAGEPNNAGNEDYTELNYDGYWNDYPETNATKAIIEKAGQPFELLSGPASGDPFPIGLTQVIYKGIDDTGEAVFSHFNVTVTDNEAPQFTNYPNDITIDVDSGSCGAIVNYTTPTATDNCDTNSYYVALSESTLNDLSDWTIIDNNGDGWTINSDNHFQTSYNWDSKSRIIDLLSLNYDPEVLDTSPDIIVSENYIGGAPNYTDYYRFKAKLLDANGNELDSFDSGLITTTDTVQTISHTFSGYPAGVRQIVIEDGGRDMEDWLGNFGSIMYGTQIQIQNKVLVKQIAGLANGDTYPVGTTTNVFQAKDLAGNYSNCSFNVSVTDNEGPQFANCPNNINVDVDSGSCDALVNYTTPTATDNCDTNSYYVALSEHTLNDLSDWTIMYNDGDGWIVNADNHFQTSNGWNSKKRVIDLLSLNYDPEVLDTSPDIIVSENYIGGAPNYADLYGFIVRLLDTNGNELDSFDAGVITTTDTVQTISHTFSGYPAGVRQIVIEDSGRDAEGWTGHHGSIMYGTQIQIQNKVIEKQITGLADGDTYPVGTTTNSFQAKDLAGNVSNCTFNITVSDNEGPQFANCPNDITVDVDTDSCGALVNYTMPTATDNCNTNSYYVALSEHTLNDLNDWTIIDNNGDGWTINSDNHFQTSYAWDSKSRAIDLLNLNYDPEVLDTSPDIIVSENYIGGAPNYTDYYRFKAKLLDANGNELDSFDSGLITTTDTVQTISHTFSGYPAGVRQIVIEDGGRDMEGWLGNFGSIMYGTQIQIQNNVLTSQTSGLADGDTYPVGTTTNEFQAKDLAGNISNCTFNVTITDNELPEIVCPGNQEVTLQAGENSYVLPDYVANNDVTASDNCSVNITQSPAAGTNLSAGTYQINFEATDPSGNAQTCSFELIVNNNNGINENYQTNNIKLYPNPAKNSINLEITENVTIKKIEIYDITGRKLYSEIFTNNFKNKSMNISKLATGKYFMHLQTNSGLYIKQFLVNK